MGSFLRISLVAGRHVISAVMAITDATCSPTADPHSNCQPHS